VKAKNVIASWWKPHPTFVYIISDKGVFTSLNPAFEASPVGHAPNGWTNHLRHWCIRKMCPSPRNVSESIAGRDAVPFELRILSKSGKYLVGEFTATPYIKDGKVAGNLGVARDITERKLKDEVREQSVSLLRRHWSPRLMEF